MRLLLTLCAIAIIGVAADEPLLLQKPALSRLIQNYGDVFSVRPLEPIVCR